MPEPLDPEILAMFHRLLAAPDPGAQSIVIVEALEFADQGATLAWEGAVDQPPLDRFLIALRVAVEELQAIGAALGPAAGRDPGTATATTRADADARP